MPVVNYLWNPLNDNIVREFDDAGTVIAEYTTESSMFGNVVSQRRNGQDSVYHYDGHGSTLALTDTNGNVTDTYSYSAFGEVTGQTGSTVNPFQYIGQKQYYLDSESREYDVRHRPLSPSLIRWFAVDPLAAHGFSRSSAYVYSENNPVLFLDPSGLIVKVTPTALEISLCEVECAKYGWVVGPLEVWEIDTPISVHRVSRCNCRKPPKVCGTCTPQELSYLQVAKDAVCAGAAKPRPDMRCARLEFLMHANTFCAATRQAIQARCFKGLPDKVHDDLVAQHTQWAIDALKYHVQKPCLPMPSSEPFPNQA